MAHPRTPVDTAALIAAYREGASLDQVAARFGVSSMLVYRRLKEAGEPRRAGRPRKKVA